MYQCKCGREFNTKSGLGMHGNKCNRFEKHTKHTYKLIDGTYKCECEKLFSNAQSLNAHFSHCLIHRKGKQETRPLSDNFTKWNKGLNKNTDLRIKQIAKKRSDNLINGITINPFKGKLHNEKSKELISLARLNFLENRPNNNIKWYSISNGIKLIKVQGEWELKVANWLNSNGINWERKRLKFLTHSYTPDFYIDDKTLIEVKGWMKDRDLFKMKKFLEYNPQFTILLVEKTELLKLDTIKITDLKNLKEKYNFEKINIEMFKSYNDLK